MKIGSTIHFYKSNHSPEFVKGTVTGLRRIPGGLQPPRASRDL